MLKYKANLNPIAVYKPGSSVIEGFDHIIKLSSNENAYGTCPSAVDAYHRAATELYKYPDGSCAKLKKVLADTYDVDQDRIVCGAGSDDILELLALTFIGSGDEVIFTDKTFPVYRIVTYMAGGNPIEVPYTSDYRHDIDQIIQKITSKTRLIFLATPDNPTGSYVPSQDMERLIQATPENCLVVIDEAYYEFVTASDYKNGLDFANTYPNIVVTRTFSKVFGLAGLRIGWGYVPSIAAEGMNKIRSPFNINYPAQMATIAALQDQEWLIDNINKNIEQRNRMVSFYKRQGIRFIPSQANFICLIRDDVDQLDQFLKSKGIIVRNMSSNQSKELIRITIGTPEQNDRLEMALEEYLV